MRKLLLAAAISLAALTSAHADITCAVNSPDGELNVRENTTKGPGKIIGAVRNGNTVNVLDVFRFDGKVWARVSHRTTGKPVGWMYRDYLDCRQAEPQQPQQPPARAATLGKDLVRKCNSDNRDDIWFCDGFLAGVFQMIWTMQETDNPIACMPQTSTSVDLLYVAEEHMRKQPELYDAPAAIAVAVATGKKYGTKCPRS
jgi:hypothetical protein